jgi:methyl-accepting chemotaxis protein
MILDVHKQISDANDMVVSIATAVEEQAVTNREISEAIEETRESTQLISATIESTSEDFSTVIDVVREFQNIGTHAREAADDLNKQAHELKSMSEGMLKNTSKFKL